MKLCTVLCEDIIAYPEIMEYKVVKVLFLNKTSELGAAASESPKREPRAKAVKSELESLKSPRPGQMTKRM